MSSSFNYETFYIGVTTLERKEDVLPEFLFGLIYILGPPITII